MNRQREEFIMKKITKLVSCLVLVSMLTLSSEQMAQAEILDYENYKGIIHVYDGSRVVNYKGNKRKLRIPYKIHGSVVTEVLGLEQAKKLTELHIPKDVYRLYVSMAPALKKVTIDKKNKHYKVKNNLVVNKKGTQVESCPGGITKVKIPDSIKIVGGFWGGNIKKVIMGKKVKELDYDAFSGCKKLTSVKLNTKLKSIGGRAFEDCKRLTQITIPKNVTFIGEDAFYGCTSLRKVVIKCEKQAPEVGAGAFDVTKEGINFFVKNKEVAKQLSEELLGSRIVNANIYVGTELVYSNITGTEEAWEDKAYDW